MITEHENDWYYVTSQTWCVTKNRIQYLTLQTKIKHQRLLPSFFLLQFSHYFWISHSLIFFFSLIIYRKQAFATSYRRNSFIHKISSKYVEFHINIKHGCRTNNHSSVYSNELCPPWFVTSHCQNVKTPSFKNDKLSWQTND